MLDNSHSGAIAGVGAGIGRAVIGTAVNSGGTAQAASFSVDLDQIPSLIAKYEEAQQKLTKIGLKANQLRAIGAPGEDEISKQLADRLGKMATGEPGCLMEAVNDGLARLNHQIDQLRSAQSGYQTADESATPNQI